MTSTKKFWQWFEKNNQSLLNLNNNGIEPDIKEKLLDDLLEHLHEYCDHLYFEIGGMPGQEQELVITAEGDTDYFEKVQELIDAAPIMKDWNWIAFKQPGDLDYTSNFEDVELKPKDIWFLPLNSKSAPKSIGFKVCLPNYDAIKDSGWLKAAVYKMLDTALGEKSFALDVGHVEIGDLPPDPVKEGLIELNELGAFIKWKKAKIASL